jgi:hypothetical protein
MPGVERDAPPIDRIAFLSRTLRTSQLKICALQVTRFGIFEFA